MAIDSIFIRCQDIYGYIQYIPRNMHTVFALLYFVVVIHWLIFPYPSGLLHWHCGNLTIAPVPAKQPWWIWINTSCEFIMNDCITTTKQSTTKPCAYFLGYTVYHTSSTQSMIMMITSPWSKFLDHGIFFSEHERPCIPTITFCMPMGLLKFASHVDIKVNDLFLRND